MPRSAIYNWFVWEMGELKWGDSWGGGGGASAKPFADRGFYIAPEEKELLLYFPGMTTNIYS